jgi:hypothetical protein
VDAIHPDDEVESSSEHGSIERNRAWFEAHTPEEIEAARQTPGG